MIYSDDHNFYINCFEFLKNSFIASINNKIKIKYFKSIYKILDYYKLILLISHFKFYFSLEQNNSSIILSIFLKVFVP